MLVKSTSPTLWIPKIPRSEQDIPVEWFKFIHPSPKPRMTKTHFQIAVHVAYSPIASMNYKWTINLHDGYPLFQVMKPEGYIPPSLHTLSNHKLTVLHLVMNTCAPATSYCPLGTMGRVWKQQPMRKMRSMMIYTSLEH